MTTKKRAMWDLDGERQGRSQDFSVGTHSFPSHLFTPPPPTKKKDQSHFRFTCLLFQIYKYKYIWNIFFYFIYLFIYLFFLLLFSGTQLRICVQVATPLKDFCKIIVEKIEGKFKTTGDCRTTGTESLEIDANTIQFNCFMTSTRHEFYEALIIKKIHSL